MKILTSDYHESEKGTIQYSFYLFLFSLLLLLFCIKIIMVHIRNFKIVVYITYN